jgi:acyl-CoA synthetase (AMP-forming)/AMP-acid ligase II
MTHESQPQMLYASFLATADRLGRAPFLCTPYDPLHPEPAQPVEVAYDTARERILELRRFYEQSGVGTGHRAALLFGNHPDYFLHLLALNGLGASVVPINPDSTADEMAYLLEHSEADFAIARAAKADDLAGASRHLAEPVPVYIAGGFPERLSPRRGQARALATDRQSEAILLYTSGTTGQPKCCIISNEYCFVAGHWYLSLGGRLTITPASERLLNPLPVHHMNAGILSFMVMLLSGGCLILPDRFHPRRWWQDVAATQATIIHYLGIMPPLLLKQEPAIEEQQHRIKFGVGAGVDPQLHAAFEQRFHFPLIEVWGMTETGRLISDNFEPRRVGTRAFGRPADGLETRVVDDSDRPVPPGQPGELLVRMAGPNSRHGFFAGYLKDRAATEETWRGGWFHTGDVVRQDPDGMLYFVERKKNIIRRSGENIAAAEVEAAIITHPAVLAVAVMPIADELREEEVMACIVLAPGAAPDRATAASIFAHCFEHLAYFKAPGWIVVRSSLPTTTTNKVQKRLIFSPDENPCTTPLSFDFRQEKRRPGSAA